MSKLVGHLRWLLRSRRTRQLDAQAIAIADRYGMRNEYLEARKFGLDPLSSLEDWDLIKPEERASFLEPYNATTAPQPLIAGKDPQSPALNNNKRTT